MVTSTGTGVGPLHRQLNLPHRVPPPPIGEKDGRGFVGAIITEICQQYGVNLGPSPSLECDMGIPDEPWQRENHLDFCLS
jgi:hypothetical protein